MKGHVELFVERTEQLIQPTLSFVTFHSITGGDILGSSLRGKHPSHFKNG